MKETKIEPQVKPKKATNRDVAEFAGVSVATVSYVINGRTDKHISEATRKKVLHAANFLNYAPNPYAVGLSTTRSRSLVIRSCRNISLLQELENACFIRRFASVCAENNYQLSYSADKEPDRITASACICVGMSRKEFYAISDENFIPVIVLDGLVNDPVFYQITADYSRIRSFAQSHFGDDFTYIALATDNDELNHMIMDELPGTVFVREFQEAAQAIQQCQNVVISQPSVAEIAKLCTQSHRILFYEDYVNERLPKIIETVNNAIDRVSVTDEMHFVKV